MTLPVFYLYSLSFSVQWQQPPQEQSSPSSWPQPEQPPKASSDDDFVIPPDKRVYYATANGKKYHLAGCSYLKGKDVVEVSQADVDSGKYEPCSRCFKNK